MQYKNTKLNLGHKKKKSVILKLYKDQYEKNKQKNKIKRKIIKN